MSNITLYGISASRAIRSIWAAEEIGLEYTHVPTHFGRDAKHPDYLAINPNGRIPTLVDGDLVLFESMAINTYLARKYGKRVRDFKGSQIKVTDARKVKSFQEVRAVAKLRGQSPFQVSFMVSDRSGRDKFFDLLIEGISLLKAERTEVGAMLDRRRGDVDALIADLKKAG